MMRALRWKYFAYIKVSPVKNRNALRIFLNQQHHVMTEAEARTY